MSTDEQVMIKGDEFTVWQPNCVGLVKGGEDKWRIGGFASTEALDRQGESVLQRGLDFSEFVHYGYFNDNHQQHTSAVVGIPEMAEYRKGQGWYTEGYLLKEVARAQEIYNLAKALDGESDRKLGFSIEGKVLERMGNKITKAIIRNVAVTNAPVNTECSWTILAKSFATTEDRKSLSVGHDRAASSGSRVLTNEDLERDEIKWIYRCPHCSKAFGTTSGVEEHLVKSHMQAPITAIDYPSIRRSIRDLSRDDAFEFIHRVRPEYSNDTVTRLVDYVFRHV